MRVKDASNRLIKDVAKHYINNDGITLKKVARDFNLSNETFVSNLLFRGIAENILDDKITRLVIKKIVYRKDIGIYQRKVRWEQEAMALRNGTKSEKKKQEEKLTFQKEALRIQINSYDDFFFDEEGAPSKKELMDRFNRLP